MTTVTIELTVDQLFEAMRKLPEDERIELLKRLGEMDADRTLHESSDLPGFGLWKDRKDITDSAEYAEQLRRDTSMRQDER